MLKPKMNKYRARAVCTSVQSDQALYTVGWQATISHLDIPKNDNIQKWKVGFIPFKIEIQQVMVNGQW